MEPTKDQLPPDVSLDFRMTEENLFCVWYCASNFQKAIGSEDIFIEWLLCDARQEDLGDHLKKRAGDMTVIAFFQFKELENIVKNLQHSSSFLSFWRKSYLVVSGGSVSWSTRPQGKVLLKGSFSDLEEIYNQGKTILDKKDYRKVFGDTRKVSKGHPSDWLYFMRDPVGALDIRDTIKMLDGHK